MTILPAFVGAQWLRQVEYRGGIRWVIGEQRSATCATEPGQPGF